MTSQGDFISSFSTKWRPCEWRTQRRNHYLNFELKFSHENRIFLLKKLPQKLFNNFLQTLKMNQTSLSIQKFPTFHQNQLLKFFLAPASNRTRIKLAGHSREYRLRVEKKLSARSFSAKAFSRPTVYPLSHPALSPPPPTRNRCLVLYVNKFAFDFRERAEGGEHNAVAMVIRLKV